MPDGNGPSPPRYLGTIGELLAPLHDQFAQSPSRVRSLREARAALRIPLSDADEVLRAWGKPADFQLAAFSVADPEQPELIAEFAVLRVFRRRGRELVPASRDARLSLKAKSNSLWVVYGSVVTNTAGTHVIESLSIGPAFPGQLSRAADDLAHGITAALLRLVSPARLLSETIEKLRRDYHALSQLEQRGGHPVMPASQRDAFAKIEAGKAAQTAPSTDQIRMIAERYLTLVQLGNTRPLQQLADEFGTTRDQMRDRVHKARTDGYLSKGTPGRAGATPGPRLKNWAPPSTTLTQAMAAEWTSYGTGTLLTMTPEDATAYTPMACPYPRPPMANPVVYIANNRGDSPHVTTA
jgi:hypothetical protein